MADTPDAPKRAPGPMTIATGLRASEARARAEEAARAEERRQADLAENQRTDERVDGFAKLTIDNMKESHATALKAKDVTIDTLKLQLRVAAVLVFFLVGVIVVLAGRALDFSIGADGLKFGGGQATVVGE